MSRVSRSTPLLLLAALFAACTDAPQPLTGPAGVAATPRFAAQGGGTGKSSLDLIEEDYDAGALDKDNANR